MIKVSELLSKRLVCLSTAEIAGTISNIIFDNKMISGKLLEIYNDDDNDAEIKYVELKKIKSLDFDAATISDNNCFTSAWNTELSGIVNPINCECYNQDGKALGIVRDITLDGTKVVTILVDKTEFDPRLLMSFSKQLLIFNDTGKPIKIVKSKVIVPTNVKINQTVTIHNEEKAVSPAADIKPEGKIKNSVNKTVTNIINSVNQEKYKDTISVPSKVPKENTVVTRTPNDDYDNKNQYAFLIGKRLTKDIKNTSGDIILAQDTYISEASITLAKESGKLVQLALHAE